MFLVGCTPKKGFAKVLSNCFGLFLFVVPHFCIGQISEPASIKRIDSLIEINGKYWDNGSDSLRLHAETVLQMAEQLNYKIGIIKANIDLWKYYHTRENYAQAIAACYNALAQNNNLSAKTHATILSNLSLTFNSIGEYDSAKTSILKAIEIDTQLNNYHALVSDYINLALTFDNLSEYKKALLYASKAYLLSRFIKDPYQETISLLNAGEASLMLNQMDRGIAYLEQSIKISTTLADTVSLAYAYYYIGSTKYVHTTYFDKEKTLLKSLSFSKATQENQLVRHTYKALAEYYQNKGEPTKAFAYLNLYHQLDDTLFTDNARIKMLKQNTAYYLAKDKAFITQLKENVALKETTIRNQYILIAILILFFVLIVLVFIYIKNLQYKYSLAEAKTELAKKELIFLKDQFNPHFLLNALTSLYKTSLMDKEKISEQIMQLADLLKGQIKLAQLDYIPIEEEINFIHKYINYKKGRIKRLTIDFKIEGNIPPIKIPSLIFLPLIENAIKYTLETEKPVVKINISIEQNYLCLRAINSFTKEQNKNSVHGTGNGLLNLRRRLVNLGQKFELNCFEQNNNMYIAILQIWY
ncbi:MAG: histidine kinase [Chryseotalea sp.]|jgi:tetratricopeptide (TPR) repeat protein